MAVNHEKESIIFMAKKIIALIDIQIMNNREQKKFEDKTENFAEIKANTMHF